MTKPLGTKQLATALIEAINAADLDAIAELWAPGAVERIHGLAELEAPSGQRQWFGAVFAAFPDFRLTAHQLIVSRETAVVRWRATGTFAGPGRFGGLVPNGAEAGLEGVTILTVADGLARAAEVHLNATELSRQLGAAPAPGSLGERAVVAAANARTAANRLLERIRERG